MRFRLCAPILFLLLLGNSCSRKSHVKSTELSHQYLVTAAVDSSTYKILQPYKEKLDKEMNEVVSFSEEPLNKDLPEGALGDFVSDCLLQKSKEYLGAEGSKVDAVLLNNGGLRVSLPQGEITKGKIFELMPFDNELVLVELSGRKFYEMLVFISEKGGMPISGIRMEINPKKRPVNVKVNGSDLDTLRTYSVISSDYLAEGGDNMEFFKNATKRKYLKVTLRDAILEYCRELKKQNKTINVKTDGRLSFSK